MAVIRFDDVGPCGVTREHLARLPVTPLQMLVMALGAARGGRFTADEIAGDVNRWIGEHGSPTKGAVVEYIRSDFDIGFGLRLAARRESARLTLRAKRRWRPPR